MFTFGSLCASLAGINPSTESYEIFKPSLVTDSTRTSISWPTLKFNFAQGLSSNAFLDNEIRSFFASLDKMTVESSSPILMYASKLSFGFHEYSLLCSKPLTSLDNSINTPNGNLDTTLPVTV